MPKIRVLAPDVVNKIAAGEVVERPASVVKELCENSLDAGATRVEVELDDGGRERVLVVDDGAGMSAEDALLCLTRHATSKLTDAAGLFAIETYGFRGEALPAIASVARLSLTTCEPAAVSGTRIVVEAGEVRSVEPAGAPRGTAVEIRDLFFATPARRKFLKRAETELGHAAEAVVRLALARPDVAFTLRSGGRATFHSPGGADPRERVAAAIGKDVFPHLLAVEHGAGVLSVRGLVASPEWSTATPRAIYTFVNGRFVRDRQLLHAIGRAFAEVLPPGRQPAAVLFLALAPGDVDVNVHPQKLEVRFADPRAVYDLVYRAVGETLRTTPWLRPSSGAAEASGRPYGVARSGQAPFDWSARARAEAGRYPTANPEPAQGSRGPGVQGSGGEQAGSPWPLDSPAPSPFPAEPPTADGGPDTPPPGYFGALRFIGQLARTFLVCEAPGGTLVILDQHAAHERLTFHRLREGFRARRTAGQPFLFPATVELGVADARALLAHLPELERLGFEVEPFGGTTFAVKSVPAPLVGSDYPRVLSDMARELASVGEGRAIEDALDGALATMACHASVRANQALTAEEARALLTELDRIDFAARCPHGRPVVTELSLAELEKRVGRR